jgi:glycerol-3-phosphate dehydrogenase (NAD(P)+)
MVPSAGWDRRPEAEAVIQQVTIIGSGSWGTALAIHLGRIGHEVRLWGRDPALVDEMIARRANPVYLPDVVFPASLQPISDLSAALRGARLVVVAVPSHGLRAVLRAATADVTPGALVVSAAKGIEEQSLQRM